MENSHVPIYVERSPGPSALYRACQHHKRRDGDLGARRAVHLAVRGAVAALEVQAHDSAQAGPQHALHVAPELRRPRPLPRPRNNPCTSR
jgi:hypothetical protein